MNQKDFQKWVIKIGGVSKAMDILGLSRSAVYRYINGERLVHPCAEKLIEMMKGEKNG